MKALIVGMGFGRAVYANIYDRWGWDVVFVDAYNEDAHYKEIPTDGAFDIAHICTPNYTHYDLANAAAKVSKIVFVEKPGVSSAAEWGKLQSYNPRTRLMVTKNNQHRWTTLELEELKQRAASAESIKINWINKDRVPHPGSWFTEKKLAFGGVSRDLMPHLLSIYQLLDPKWKHTPRTKTVTKQNWTLQELVATDYGDVNVDGTYNVDDSCLLQYNNCTMYANWRSTDVDDFAIYFDDERIELGPLCPEDAYEQMILRARERYHDDAFWKQQEEMDKWLHLHVATL